MRKELDAWLKDTGARIPQQDKRFDAEKRKRQDNATATKRMPSLEKQHAHFLDPNFKPNNNWWGSKVTED